ncbi:MAG: hypothetical protein HY347_11335 [candidate division NC10 bacterium]|nr:hypothetical protein [candidate division NC10 bacterium]
MRVVEYVAPLGLDGRRRIRHVRVKGRVVELMVQYELQIEGEWYPVVRYDTAHGFAHKDVLHWQGLAEKSSLPTADYNLALTYAEDDLRKHWQRYREHFLEEVRRR